MWKSVLKLFLVKKIFMGLMNNARDPHKKKCTARKRTSQTEARVCLDTAYY